jgi:hypothetical protein
MLKVRRDGDHLIIHLPIKAKAKRSKSGKSKVIGTSRGPVATGVYWKKRCIWLVVNAFIYPNTEEGRERAAVELHKIQGRIAIAE